MRVSNTAPHLEVGRAQTGYGLCPEMDFRPAHQLHLHFYTSFGDQSAEYLISEGGLVGNITLHI